MPHRRPAHGCAASRTPPIARAPRSRAEKGAFPLFDADEFLEEPNRRAPRCRRPCSRRDERHAQQPSDVDRTDGHDLAVRRQRVLGDRADLLARLPPRGDCCPTASRREEEVSDHAARLFRACSAKTPSFPRPSLPPRRCRRTIISPCRRRCSLSSIPRYPRPSTARRHLVRCVQGHLCARLCVRPQGLHHLPAQRRDRSRADRERTGDGPAGPAARRAAARGGGRRRAAVRAAPARAGPAGLHLQAPLAGLPAFLLHHHQ